MGANKINGFGLSVGAFHIRVSCALRSFFKATSDISNLVMESPSALPAAGHVVKRAERSNSA